MKTIFLFASTFFLSFKVYSIVFSLARGYGFTNDFMIYVENFPSSNSRFYVLQGFDLINAKDDLINTKSFKWLMLQTCDLYQTKHSYRSPLRYYFCNLVR